MFGAFLEQTARYLSSLLSHLTCALVLTPKFFLFDFFLTRKNHTKRRKIHPEREREREREREKIYYYSYYCDIYNGT